MSDKESDFNESKATYIVAQDTEIELPQVIVPKDENYPMAKNVRVIGLIGFLKFLEQRKKEGIEN